MSITPKKKTLHLHGCAARPIIKFTQDTFAFSSMDNITLMDILGLVANAATDENGYERFVGAFECISYAPESINASIFKCFIKMEMELNAGNINREECGMIVHFVNAFVDEIEDAVDFGKKGSIEVKLWKDLEDGSYYNAVNIE